MSYSSRYANLRILVARGDMESLCRTVTGLRTADYRTVCSMMREAEFWASLRDEDTFWRFARHFIQHDSKAFLGTFLRATVSLHAKRPMDFRSEAFDEFLAQCLTPVDCRKTIEAIAPLMTSPEALATFLARLKPLEGNHALLVNILFHINTDSARFLFFRELRQHEDDAATLRRYAVELVRRGDRRSLNLARIIECYFALPPLPGTFALQMPEYQFSRLDRYEAFCKILAQ